MAACVAILVSLTIRQATKVDAMDVAFARAPPGSAKDEPNRNGTLTRADARKGGV